MNPHLAFMAPLPAPAVGPKKFESCFGAAGATQTERNGIIFECFLFRVVGFACQAHSTRSKTGPFIYIYISDFA